MSQLSHVLRGTTFLVHDGSKSQLLLPAATIISEYELTVYIDLDCRRGSVREVLTAAAFHAGMPPPSVSATAKGLQAGAASQFL